MQEFLARIKESKAKAIEKGSIINLRKEDVTKQKAVGVNYKITYSWYQTPAKVGIEIPYTVENRDDLSVKFDDYRVTIDFPIQNGGHYHLDLVLFSKIVPPRCKKTHRLSSIEVIMDKANPSQNWAFLRKDGLGAAEGQQQEKKLVYPSSSKTKKNWDKIDRQIEGDILKRGEQFGQDPGMTFFKQIFSNSDSDKRRAMMKSFQTSGGTVLSTDWDDVSKKDYEGKDRPSPPKGQEWRKPQI